MNLENLRAIVSMVRDLSKEDPEAALCLMDWSRVTLGRSIEREKARAEHRKPSLEPVELRPPSLADLGVNVVGCSACARTYKDRTCPGCGNPGMVPRHGKKGAKAQRGRR